MRLYKRSRDDQINACRRSAFDARTGRLKLAFSRLNDIRDEPPVDDRVAAMVWYTEGVLRRDSGGQGLQAYKCFCKAHDFDSSRSDAIINATLLASDEADFRKWVKSARTFVPDSEREFHDALEEPIRALEEGMEYWMLMHDIAMARADSQNPGPAAAAMEIALASHDLSPTDEAAKRRWRAQQLRALDQNDQEMRRAHHEHFAPDERIVLLDALSELDQAIAVDDNDAEIWNLRASYCLFLERWQEAIDSTERSSQLRPHGYAKPYINRSLALWALKKDASALEAARTAQSHAGESGDAADKQRADELVEQFSQPRPSLSRDSWTPLIRDFLTKSAIIADRERQELFADATETHQVSIGFFRRCQRIANEPTLSFVPVLAELMSDFTPERVFQVVSSMTQIEQMLQQSAGSHIPKMGLGPLSQQLHDQCLHAALYIVAHSSTIMQRDAARFLWLTLFGALEPSMIRSAYRESILGPSAAANDEFSELDRIMRGELTRIQPNLVSVIVEQPAIDDRELRQARERILHRFHRRSIFGNAPGKRPFTPEGAGGCLLLFAFITLIVLTGDRSEHSSDENRPAEHIVDISNSDLITFNDTHKSTTIVSLDFSPDGLLLASAGNSDSEVKIWSLRTGTEYATFTHGMPVACVEFTRDGSWLLTGGVDASGQGKICTWSMDPNSEAGQISDIDGEVRCMALSPDDTMLAIGATGGRLFVRYLSEGVEYRVYPQHTADVTAVCFTPDGARVAYSHATGMITITDLSNLGGRRDFDGIQNFQGHATAVTALSFSHDGGVLVSGAEDGEVKLWRFGDEFAPASTNLPREAPDVQRLHTRRVTGIVCVPGADAVLSSSLDGKTLKWDIASGTATVLESCAAGIGALAVSDDGTRHAVGEAGLNGAAYPMILVMKENLSE